MRAERLTPECTGLPCTTSRRDGGVRHTTTEMDGHNISGPLGEGNFVFTSNGPSFWRQHIMDHGEVQTTHQSFEFEFEQCRVRIERYGRLA